MSEVKWIKIVTDIFDDEKILLIESMPEGDSIIVIWFKLLCLAGKKNNNGVFLLNDRIHYTDEMFATIFRRSLNTVRLALNTFEQFGMIEIIDNTVTIPNWGKHQKLDALEAKTNYQREYMRNYREKQRQLAEGVRKTNGKTNSKTNGEPDGETNCETNSEANVSSPDKIRLDKINKKEEERACAHEETNPYGDGDCRPQQGTIQQYATNNLRVMGARAMEELNSFVDDLGDDLVRHAIDNALDNSVTNWSYVRAILNDYLDAGVKTVGEAKELDAKRRKGRGQRDRPESTTPAQEAPMTQEQLEYALSHGPFGKFY